MQKTPTEPPRTGNFGPVVLGGNDRSLEVTDVVPVQVSQHRRSEMGALERVGNLMRWILVILLAVQAWAKPIHHEALYGKISLDITPVKVGQKAAPAWCYRTHGLKPEEVSLTLLRRAKEQAKDYPTEPIQLLRSFARAGKAESGWPILAVSASCVRNSRDFCWCPARAIRPCCRFSKVRWRWPMEPVRLE